MSTAGAPTPPIHCDTDPDDASKTAFAEPVHAAAQRMNRSRQRIRAYLVAAKGTAEPASSDGGDVPHGALLSALIAMPLIGGAVDQALSWWSHHPLQKVAGLLFESISGVARPVTRQHPWGTVLASVAFGAFLVWARPWRFKLLRRAVVAGLVPRLVTGMLEQLSSGKWMEVVESFITRSNAPPAAPVEATERTPAPAFETATPSTPMVKPSSLLH